MIRFEDLRVRDQQVMDRDFFNRRFRLIAENIGQLGEEVASVTSDTDRLVALGLTRVNEVLGPLLARMQAVAENGFLVASSPSSATISIGLRTTFEIPEGPQRELFTPTPYVLITRNADGAENDYAILRVESYNRENGGLAAKVVLVNGNITSGQHNDWVISATAGLSASVINAAVLVQEALSATQEAAAIAQEAAATAETNVANGPVASVNGKTGRVSLGLSDIAGLVAALSSKAESSHGHTIAQISNLQSTLDAITDGGSY